MKLVVLAVALAVTGCEYTTRQRQVGLVPAPRPTSFDGQRLQGYRIEGHASTTLEPATTARVSQPERSSYVARDVLGGAVFAGNGELELGVALDSVRARGAVAKTVEADRVVPPTHSGYTLAVSLRRSVPLDGGWSLGIAGELGWTEVPVTLDADGYDSDQAALLRAALVPSYRVGGLTVFGSLTATNDIAVASIATLENGQPEATASGLAIIPAVGASVRFADGVKLTTLVAKPFNTAVDYGPQLSLSLGYELGR